jgi:hypothetical protein
MRIAIVISIIFLSTIGFMVKLPTSFRHYDKELHTLFYFLASGFLNILFQCKNISKHLLIFLVLLGFGFGIEYAQEYSNKFFNSRIHGRFDKEDIEANLKGLISFSFIWFTYFCINFFRKIKIK